MANALELIPDVLLVDNQDETRKLFSEIFESYAKAMRTAIIQYILICP